MKTRLYFLAAFAGIFQLCGNSAYGSLITQGATDDFVAFEAETFVSSGGFVLVDQTNQYQMTSGSQVLPAGSTASGGAVMIDAPASGSQWNGPNGGNGPASYHVSFATEGDYYLYIRYSNFDADNNGDYWGDDSIFIPTDFGELPITSTGGGEQDLGQDPFGQPTGEGQDFIWKRAAGRGGANPNAVYNIRYSVSAGQLDQRLIFNIEDRESGTTLDRFVFSEDGGLTATELDALSNSFVAVPEPSSVVALIGLLAALGLRRKSRKLLS